MPSFLLTNLSWYKLQVRGSRLCCSAAFDFAPCKIALRWPSPCPCLSPLSALLLPCCPCAHRAPDELHGLVQRKAQLRLGDLTLHLQSAQ